MKKTDFNELIEKAFSMGYEYGQKEFASIRQATKIAKRLMRDGINSEVNGRGGTF